CAALFAARRCDIAHRHHLPRALAGRQSAQADADEILAQYRLRLCGRRGHLAFGRHGRAGGQDPGFDPSHLFRRCRAAALPAQSRQANRQFPAQRNPLHRTIARRLNAAGALRPGARSAHIKAPLTPARHGRAMVTRKRLRTVLNALALYIIAALVIGYFGVNAYSGNHGLRAKQDLDRQIAELSDELASLKAERAGWERRVVLLKPESIDPAMLDERARVLLNNADPRELPLRRKHP